MKCRMETRLGLALSAEFSEVPRECLHCLQPFPKIPKTLVDVVNPAKTGHSHGAFSSICSFKGTDPSPLAAAA